MERDAYGFPVGREWPVIDATGMREVDRLMAVHYGISLSQMMENAGRALATLARVRFLGGDARGARVVVLAGGGGNGGGALAAARRLATWGAEVFIVLAQEAAAMSPVPARQLAILGQMGLLPGEPPAEGTGLVLDGLIGYSLSGAPRGRAVELISWAGSGATPVLSLDVPSGFDAASGTLFNPSIAAAATLTLALPKSGLPECEATGDLYVADISVPPALYKRLPQPLSVPVFSTGDIVRLAGKREATTVAQQRYGESRQGPPC